MSLHLITPSAALVLPLTEAKAFLRVTSTADDAVITGLICGVAEWLAGQDGWLQRSLAPTTWEIRFPCFPFLPHILLPRPPFIAVDSFTYEDDDGVDQTLGAEHWAILYDDDGMPYLTLAVDEQWPSGTNVRVRYRAGYTDGESPEGVDLPAGLKNAVLMTVARLYDDRESGLPGSDDPMVRSWFAPYRIFVG